MSEYVTDALVVLDGYNPSFFSYIDFDEANRLLECGLNNAEKVNLKETPDRPIPDSLKRGETEILDIQVVLMTVNMPIYLN